MIDNVTLYIGKSLPNNEPKCAIVLTYAEAIKFDNDGYEHRNLGEIELGELPNKLVADSMWKASMLDWPKELRDKIKNLLDSMSWKAPASAYRALN